MIDPAQFETMLRNNAKQRGYDAALTDDYVTKGLEWLAEQQKKQAEKK